MYLMLRQKYWIANATKWFILASGNPHKSEEFNTLFDTDIIGVKAASEKLEVLEDGDTFTHNALKKAEAYYKKYKSLWFRMIQV